MPRFVQLRTNRRPATGGTNQCSQSRRAAPQPAAHRGGSRGARVRVARLVAPKFAPRPAPFARATRNAVVADVGRSKDACPRTYVYALPRTLSDWAPGDASPDDGVDANANLLEVLVEALQKRCSTKSPADAELFLIPVLPRAKHWSDWMRRCDKLAKLGARDWRRALPHLNMETARRHVFVFPRVATRRAARAGGPRRWSCPSSPGSAWRRRCAATSARRLDGVWRPARHRRGPRIEERASPAQATRFAGARAPRRSASTRQRAHPEALVPRPCRHPARRDIMVERRRRGPAPLCFMTPRGSETPGLRLALQRPAPLQMIAPTAAAAAPAPPAQRDLLRRAARPAPGLASIVTALLAGCIPVLFAPEQTGLALRRAAGGTRRASCRHAPGGEPASGTRAGGSRERRRRHARDGHKRRARSELGYAWRPSDAARVAAAARRPSCVPRARWTELLHLALYADRARGLREQKGWRASKCRYRGGGLAAF